MKVKYCRTLRTPSSQVEIIELLKVQSMDIVSFKTIVLFTKIRNAAGNLESTTLYTGSAIQNDLWSVYPRFKY